MRCHASKQCDFPFSTKLEYVDTRYDRQQDQRVASWLVGIRKFEAPANERNRQRKSLSPRKAHVGAAAAGWGADIRTDIQIYRQIMLVAVQS